MRAPKDVIAEAAARFALEHHASSQISSDDACLIRGTRDGSGVLLRLLPEEDDHHAQTMDARWSLARLLSSRGVSVPAQHLSKEGRILERVTHRGVVWLACCVGWVDGKPVDADGTWNTDAAIIRSWGRLMGTMHREVRDLGQGAPDLPSWSDEVDSFVAMSLDPEATAAWERLRARLAELPTTADVYGPVHNDLHGMNAVVRGTEVLAIDFDVAATHWFACDVATAMQGPLWGSPTGVSTGADGALERFYLFVEGYREAFDLADEWRARTNLFLSYRRLLLYTVFSNSWKSPAGWQRHRLQVWRTGIVQDRRVLPIG